MSTPQTNDNAYTDSGSSPGITLAERFCSLMRGLTTSHGTYEVPADAVPDSKGKLSGTALTATAGAPTAALRAAAQLWKNDPVKLWEKHLSGERSLGVVPIMDDNNCVFGALDVDAYIDFDIAKLFEKSCNQLGLPLLICRSKSGGAHCLIFSAEPVPAKLMRARLAECRDALGLPGNTEVFPKQEDASDSNGSWLNCPYMGPSYGGRYSIMPWGVRQTPEEFLDYAEAGKLEASWFDKPVAYMQAAGATRRKKAKKEPPAYTNLEGGHYPEAHSEMARFVGLNRGQLTDGEIDAHVLAELEKMGVTDPAKRREYIEEFGRWGRKVRDRDQENPKKSRVSLQDLCSDFTYFNAGSMQDGFVQLTNFDHREVWPEERIEKVLVARYLKQTGRAPKREELNSVMDGVKARCMTGPREDIHSRIARSPGKIYLDLCNEKWEAVEVDKEGWRVVSNPPVYFRRSNESSELPKPMRGGSLDELRPLLNAGDDELWILMMGWLVGVFQPEGAFSHIALEGQEGTAKTTTAVNLISVVDPNEVGLCGPPKDEQDFSITAMSAGIVGFDNFSGCKEAMSDIFCRCSTGTAFRTRTLYKNREITSIKLKLPILVNGIDSIVMRGDLLRRTIVLHLPVISKETRKTEKELNRKYREAHPCFLGALLDAVSEGLKNLETTTVTNPPSMASFAHWVKACEPALPWEPGKFLAAYHNMQLGASEELFDKDEFAVALFNWVWPQIQGHKVLEISGRDLLSSLNKTLHFDRGKISPVNVKEWPTLKNVHSSVTRAAPLLSKKGLTAEWKTKRTKKTRGLWRFESATGQGKLELKVAA